MYTGLLTYLYPLLFFIKHTGSYILNFKNVKFVFFNKTIIYLWKLSTIVMTFMHMTCKNNISHQWHKEMVPKLCYLNMILSHVSSVSCSRIQQLPFHFCYWKNLYYFKQETASTHIARRVIVDVYNYVFSGYHFCYFQYAYGLHMAGEASK